METGALLKFQVHQRTLSPTSSRPAPARGEVGGDAGYGSPLWLLYVGCYSNYRVSYVTEMPYYDIRSVAYSWVMFEFKFDNL